jgi:hypothetical protein
MLLGAAVVQLMHEKQSQPGCAFGWISLSKEGCNAGKPCRFNNIARRKIGVTMRAFSGP